MAPETKTVVIESEDHDIRLDRWFKRHEPHMQFSMLAKLMRKGKIRVDGKKQDPSFRITEGETLTYPIIHVADEDVVRVKAPMQNRYIDEINDAIIFMNDDIIVLNKPAGLAVQGGSKISISVDDLAEELKFEYDQKPKLVHRLDKETSGILVMARKTSVAAELSEMFRVKQISKKYLALVTGLPKPFEGKIDIPLEKVMNDKENFEKVDKSAKGKKAITYYKVLDYASDVMALVELDLITGRTHQIRAHMSLIGHPIFGDDKYGDFESRQEKKLYLHSYKTEFEYKGEKFSFTADLPTHFKEKLSFVGLSTSVNK